MKCIVVGLTFAAMALAQHPQVSECFKVHELLRADESHYWATWTNACPYTIDAVYVLVKFADRSAREIADGVWGLHFIEPGAHRTMRFSAPGKLADFASVRQRKITADMSEAFGRPAATPMELAAIAANKIAAYKQAVAKEVRTEAVAVSAIIADAGEEIYRAQIPAQPVMPTFRTDFPDPWRAVLSPQEAAVSPSPRASFVRFVLDDKPFLP